MYIVNASPRNFKFCRCIDYIRVATVGEKNLENEFFSRSGNFEGILSGNPVT